MVKESDIYSVCLRGKLSHPVTNDCIPYGGSINEFHHRKYQIVFLPLKHYNGGLL